VVSLCLLAVLPGDDDVGSARFGRLSLFRINFHPLAYTSVDLPRQFGYALPLYAQETYLSRLQRLVRIKPAVLYSAKESAHRIDWGGETQVPAIPR
jgi:hypothetical protein